MRLFAVCTPGLEGVLADEVAALGARGAVRVTGGVELEGSPALIARANLELRTATRVLVRLGNFEAADFATLERAAAKLPWTQFLDGRPVRLDAAVTARKSRLFHTGAIAERLARALPGGTTDPAAPALGLVVRVENDQFEVSLDSSGEPLYKRGYREETAKAPLRETLAAGLLALAGWDPATPLVDPMCGSGTIVLEGASRALGRPPGAQRGFAFESWRGFSKTPVPPAPLAERQFLRPGFLRGSDRDAGAVEAARRNAARAGFDTIATFACFEAEGAPLPDGPVGLIVVNPPYGRRVAPGSPARLTALYKQLARLYRRAPPGWRLAVLSPDPSLERALGLKLRGEHPLTNGGLRVSLRIFGR